MKKFLVALIAVMLLLSMSVMAEESTTAEVYVTISDAEGNLVMAQDAVNVTDIDGNGTLTVNDALYSAHEVYYEGGAADGYGSYVSDYGTSLSKLWGVENGGSYGYCVNNASAMSLDDAIKDGDYINAYVYTDLTAWSDTYCFFDVNNIEAAQGEDVEITLSAAGFDENWNPVTLPVEGATITVNGVATEYKTDAEGKATIQISDTGYCVISADSETQTLVPPVCIATVSSSATANVFVTISNDKGALVLTQEEVTVSDIDEDGELTINDALYIAHEENYEGGAAEGYASADTDYGLSLNKLWGVENGGSYGYYVNNASAWSLADVVQEGDYINAFVYTDLSTWSDKYCYFDANVLESKAGEEIELVLSYAGYDADWNPVALPVENAVITINGESTEYKTDAEGKVVIKLDAGEYVLSAVSDAMVLVPPVCEISVTGKADVTPPTNDSNTNTDNNTNNNTNTNNTTNNTTNKNNTTNNTIKNSGTVKAPKTADNSVTWLYVAMVVVSLAVVVVTKKRNVYEK